MFRQKRGPSDSQPRIVLCVTEYLGELTQYCDFPNIVHDWRLPKRSFAALIQRRPRRRGNVKMTNLQFLNALFDVAEQLCY